MESEFVWDNLMYSIRIRVNVNYNVHRLNQHVKSVLILEWNGETVIVLKRYRIIAVSQIQLNRTPECGQESAGQKQAKLNVIQLQIIDVYGIHTSVSRIQLWIQYFHGNLVGLAMNAVHHMSIAVQSTALRLVIVDDREFDVIIGLIGIKSDYL